MTATVVDSKGVERGGAGEVATVATEADVGRSVFVRVDEVTGARR